MSDKISLLFNKNFQSILRTFSLLFFILTIANFWYVHQEGNYDKLYINYAANLKVLSQRIAKRVGETEITLSDTAFQYLKMDMDEFEKQLTILQEGEYKQGQLILPPSPPQIQKGPLAVVGAHWLISKPRMIYLLEHKTSMEDRKPLETLSHSILKSIQTEYLTILSEFQKIKTSDPRLEYLIAKQMFDSQTIMINISTLLDPLKDDKDIKGSFLNKINDFVNNGQLVADLNTNKELNALFAKVKVSLEKLKNSATVILNTANAIDMFNQNVVIIYEQNLQAYENLDSLDEAYLTASKTRLISFTTAITLGLITLLSLLLLWLIYYIEEKAVLKDTKEKNKKIQEDIHRLLHELEELAQGNLGAKASVSTGITRDIASSIDFAINSLKKLVVNINRTSKEAAIKTYDAQRITKHLVTASESQAQEIVLATSYVGSVTTLSEAMYKHAAESASVAKQSVMIAHDGGESVKNTIEGMKKIQSRIQLMSEKIRKLGESSEEISEIVSLINSFSNQTNLLSMNASIQAISAGAAGKGFAVVADEVQRLAEKASRATRDIDSLVTAIQSYTAEVINAMEETDLEVKNGGELSSEAGRALEKIVQVSKSLFELIQNISKSAEEQKSMSLITAEKMKVINDITKQTSIGSLDTAELINGLTKLHVELRNSVSQFKLPADTEDTIETLKGKNSDS